jgi:hypothetical protein
MKKNHFLTIIVAVLAVTTMFTACLGDDEPYSAGFQFTKPQQVRTSIYANTTYDTVIVYCMGPWQITSDTPEAQWCTIDRTKGVGSATYSMNVLFEQNTTGQARIAQYTITDTDHPDKAFSTWQYLQYATRGDGSLGNAALVKSITSSDDWTVTVSYDAKCRPTEINVKNPAGNNDKYSMTYDEVKSLLTVTNGNSALTGTMDNGYQVEKLVGVGDTIGYALQRYPNGVQVSANYAFNYIASRVRRTQAFAYRLDGKSLAPDSLHTADSLTYYCRWKTGTYTTSTERFRLEYGQMDNRCQTVDVNQLLLGMADCEPLQLLAMFRLTRSTSIVTKATSDKGTIDVTTELNADRSVRRMVVKDSRQGTEVTYDFAY